MGKPGWETDTTENITSVAGGNYYDKSMSVEPIAGRVVEKSGGDDEREPLGLDALDLLAAAGPAGQGPARGGAARGQGPRRVGRRVCRGWWSWLT